MKTGGFCVVCHTPTLGRKRTCEAHMRTCEIEGCDNPHLAKGLCQGHYLRRRAGREDDSPIGEGGRRKGVVSRGVTEARSVSECTFPRCSDAAYGRGDYCHGHYQQIKRGEPLRKKRYIRKNIEHPCSMPYCEKVASGLRLCRSHADKSRKYSLTAIQLIMIADYTSCDICGGNSTPSRGLHVDHDHSCCPGSSTCGYCIRGILCQGCNVGMGAFYDSTQNMSRAIDYLQGNRRKPA